MRLKSVKKWPRSPTSSLRSPIIRQAPRDEYPPAHLATPTRLSQAITAWLRCDIKSQESRTSTHKLLPDAGLRFRDLFHLTFKPIQGMDQVGGHHAGLFEVVYRHFSGGPPGTGVISETHGLWIDHGERAFVESG